MKKKHSLWTVGFLLIFACLLSSLALAQTQQLTIADLQACLDGRKAGYVDAATGRTVCELAQGTYTLDGNIIPGSSFPQPYINVWQSNYILRGASQTGTVITRGNAMLQFLIYVNPNVSNVAIESLTLNGNRFQFTQNWAGQQFDPGCFPSNDAYYDLHIHPAAGTNILISSVSLYNSPGTAVQLTSNAAAQYLDISTARSTGMHMFGNSSVSDSTVEMCGTAGITVHGSNQSLNNITLTENRHEQPDGVPGGQLNLEPGSSSATVANTTINGNDYMIYPGSISVNDALAGRTYSCPVIIADGVSFPMGVVGIEGYGSRHQLINVTVTRNSDCGVFVRGAQYWTLSGITATGNGNVYSGGVMFDSYLGQPNVGVVITSLTSTNNRNFGLSLANMLQGGGQGGCNGSISISGNPTNVWFGQNVDSVYQNTCTASPPKIGSIVDGVTYSNTITPTTTISIFGSGFSTGGNMVHLQRLGYTDVWLSENDGHYFWDYNGTQINTSLDGRAAAGTWTLTVRNASGSVSSPYTLTVQNSSASSGLSATPLSSTQSSGLSATRVH
jgi:hypothetical protein